jgi:hypothetical protein
LIRGVGRTGVSSYLAFDHLEIYKADGSEITTPFDPTRSTNEPSAITTTTSSTTPTTTTSTTIVTTTGIDSVTTTSNSLLEKIYACDFDETDCGGVPTPAFGTTSNGVYFNFFASFSHSSTRSLSDITSICNFPLNL